jgi:hypothetical protein
MTMRYAGIESNRVKKVERADPQVQQNVANQAVAAIRSALPAGEPAVAAALTAVQSGTPVSAEEADELRAVAVGYAKRVDELQRDPGHEDEAASLQHSLIAVNVLESAAVVSGEMNGDHALRAVATALMVLGKDKGAVESLLTYLDRLG